MLAAVVERSLQLRGAIEVIEDVVFPLRRDDDQLVEGGVACFLNSVLKDRFIDERQHLLRNDFRRRKEPRAEAGTRKDAGAEVHAAAHCSREE